MINLITTILFAQTVERRVRREETYHEQAKTNKTESTILQIIIYVIISPVFTETGPAERHSNILLAYI